jgi:hypothetical protein
VQGTVAAPVQVVIYQKADGTYAVRPNQLATITVEWRGTTPPPSGDGTYALRGVDTYFQMETLA